MTEGPTPGRRIGFNDSVTVITGAGNGIGRALALAMARRGALVVATDIDADAAGGTRDLITAAGGSSWAMRLDVTRTEDYRTARDFCLDTWGRVDRVVNNAGLVALGLPEHLPLSAWHRTIDVNLLGVVRSNEVFLPVLLAQGRGHVVNTASTSGLFPYSFDRLAYVATKAGVVALSESLALYLRPQGVEVSCICPAGVRTTMVDRMTRHGPELPMRTPALPVVMPDDFAEHVVDALGAGDFLICSVPEAFEAVARRGADLDANLADAVAQYGFGTPVQTPSARP
jgi:NAD(P)-dependent dehydrogenase (short-subunit alcohol dehydrogenase family)